jgi:hypothetical protein
MAAVQGGRGTGNVESSKIVVDMADMAFEQDKNIASLLSVLSANKSVESCHRPKYEWREFVPLAREDTLAEALDTSETGVDVTDGTLYLPDDIIFVPASGELMSVTSIATNTLTVVRGWGGTSGTAASSGDAVFILGQAKMEGSSVPAQRSASESAVFNYTQINRTPVDITATLMATELYGEKERTLQRRRQLNLHKQDIERAFIFGYKEEITSGTHPRRTTGGFIERTASNAAASLPTWSVITYQNWVALGQEVMRYPDASPDRSKLVLCGATLLAAINRAWEGQIQLETKETSYGLKTKNIVSDFGEFNLAVHWLLSGTTYGKKGLVVDTKLIKRRFLQGRDLQLHVDVHDRDYDGVKDEYLSETGFQLMQPAAHGVITYSGS